MRQQGISKVDYAIMHGQFEYQIPYLAKSPSSHSSEEYLKIVDKLIFIGHIHTYSRNDRILAQGSLDRICHGEEGPKGHIRATVRSRDDYEIQFVETLDAKIFKTIDCRGLSVDDSHELILRTVDPLPDGSHIRILAERANPILQSVATYEKKMPYFFWTGLGKDNEDLSIAQQTELLQKEAQYTPIEITRQNVQKLLADALAGMNLEEGIAELAELKLAELV